MRPRPAADEIQRTYTYKTVGQLELQADVYRLSDFVVGPTIISIHGGALMDGNRGIIPFDRRKFTDAGYIVVSIDHRLAPETKLPEIIEDVRDAIAWVRAQGPRLFRADPDRIAVLGASSGGYLALLAGHTVEPRLAAVVSLWGFGDLTASFLVEPDPRSLERTRLTEEDAFRVVLDHEIARRPPGTNAGRLNLYCRQQGLWPRVVTGLDASAEPEAFAQFSPIENVTADYPPTFLVHGMADTDVPSEQSVLIGRELDRLGVAHELILVPDAGQGLQGASAEEGSRLHGRMKDFLDRHLAR